MRTALFASVVLVLSSGQVKGQVKSIDEFRIEKVGLNTTEQGFLKMYPRAIRTKTDDDKYGAQVYALNDPNGESVSVFQFIDGKMSMMLVHWTKEGLGNSGGWKPILNKIVSKYGKANDSPPETDEKRAVLRWASSDTGNKLIVLLDEQGLRIAIMSKKVNDQLNELKAKKAKSKIDD